MFKLIILDSNFDLIKNLCNLVINEIPDLQLSGIALTHEDFKKLAKKVNPEIIMMNYSQFINSDYSKKLDSNTLKILFCRPNIHIKASTNTLCLVENCSTNEIIKSIQEFISKYGSTFLRNKIIKILESFNFDFKLIGTTYLLESILYCYENKTDYVFENLEKNVYPTIATMCKASVNNIKHSIVRSVNNMSCNLSPATQKQLSEIFKVDISEKTTAKQLISTIITKL